jgi:antitoxin component HigA of HigAB toxin-antitoxin module
MRVDSYLQLVREFPLRRLTTAAARARAKSVYLRLNRGRLDRGATQYLDVLADLIADYERRCGDADELGAISAAELVRHRLEERGMSVNSLAKATGVSQPNLSEMLNGTRQWSKAAIKSLSSCLGIRAERFLA